MNKKYLILGALLLLGGYVAYKKFNIGKDEDETEKPKPILPEIDRAKIEVPTDRGVVAPQIVTESAPSLVIPTSTTSTELVKNKLFTADNVATQSAPSGNLSYAGLGGY